MILLFGVIGSAFFLGLLLGRITSDLHFSTADKPLFYGDEEVTGQLWQWYRKAGATGVNTIIYEEELYCKAYSTRNAGAVIHIGHCDKDRYYRGLVVTKDDWQLFVFMHELGHIMLNSSDECAVDEYAVEWSTKLGAMPIRYHPCTSYTDVHDVVPGEDL